VPRTYLTPERLFSVSILRDDQKHLSPHFTGAARSAPWPLPFEWIVVGLVSSLYHDDDDGRPLLFFGARYLND
jgi:hypothetical protein